MKLVIAGGREIMVEIAEIEAHLKSFGITGITHIISGFARGVDYCGLLYAAHIGVPVIPFPPDNRRYGQYLSKKIRNMKMAVEGDALLLIWDGESGGSKHMKECMEGLQKPVFEVLVDKRLTFK